MTSVLSLFFRWRTRRPNWFEKKSSRADKKFAKSSTARHSRNQKQILRCAQNDMSS